MAVQVQGPFQAQIASDNQMFSRWIHMGNPAALLASNPWTATAVNCTPVVAHVGGRPAVSLAGAGASTDGENYCDGTAGFRFVSGKQTRIFCGTYLGDSTNHAFAFGVAVVTTGLVANLASGGTPPTDFFCLSKLQTVAAITLRSRKASGTEEAIAIALPSTIADAQWLDWQIVVAPSSSTSGAGTVTVYCRQNLGAWTQVAYANFGSQIPNTVSTALCLGFRAGSANTTAFAISHVGLEQEY